MHQITINCLKRLCHILATLENPAYWQELPALTTIDLPKLFELANRFWLGPALANALIANPDFNADTHGSLAKYCRMLVEGGKVRHDALKSELVRLVTFLNERDIEPLLFKGAATLGGEHDNLRGRRWMMDLDVVLPKSTVEPTWNALFEHGYKKLVHDKEMFDGHIFRPLKHAPELVGANNITVELHYRLLSSSVRNAPLQLLEKSARSRIVVAPNAKPPLRAWQLTPTDKVIQSIAHDMLDHGYYHKRSLDLRYCYHLYLLTAAAKRDVEHIDWAVVEKAFARHRKKLAVARYILSWFAPADDRFKTPTTDRWMTAACKRLNTPCEVLRQQERPSSWSSLFKSITAKDGRVFSQRVMATTHFLRDKIHQLIHPSTSQNAQRQRYDDAILQHHPDLLE